MAIYKITNITKMLKNLSRTKQITGALTLVALLMLTNYSLAKKPVDSEIEKTGREVRVASIALLSENLTPMPLLGTVTSRSEATIRAESSGKLVAVYKKLGDYVPAGGVIAEFDNGGERAQVLQAEGAYDAARAGSESAQTGRDIVAINSSSASNSLEEAKTQAQNAITSAYTTLDDAVRTKTDGAFRNPQTSDAKFAITVSDARLVIKIEGARIVIETMLRKREARNRTLTTESDLVSELNTVEEEVRMVKDYLDDLSYAFTRAIVDANASQSAIDGYKTNTGLARTLVGGVLSSVTGSRNALNASVSANKVANKNATQGNSASEASADAQVKSAQGNLDAAKVRLEKTIIRSPISGTINSLSVATGDFISPFSEIAVVSNNGALEVVAYVTDEDARQLSVGGKVAIEGDISGIITKIAPALDPKTKKIEVRIGITGTAKALTNGQSVQVNATRMSTPTKTTAHIQIPLSAIKITPNGAVVFTVNSSSTLVSHPIKEGALFGDRIEIIEGVTPDMEIVTDARGLEDDEPVSVTK